MNRRHLAVIAMIIAVGLFAAPLISLVPDYGPHLEVTVLDEPVDFPTEEAKENRLRNMTTVRYQNLSPSAQRLFKRAYKHGRDDVAVPFDKAPESWTTLVPVNTETDANMIYVRKDGRYYSTLLHRFTPGPSLQAFMLRLGPLLGAIGLGTLTGYFVLTAED